MRGLLRACIFASCSNQYHLAHQPAQGGAARGRREIFSMSGQVHLEGRGVMTLQCLLEHTIKDGPSAGNQPDPEPFHT